MNSTQDELLNLSQLVTSNLQDLLYRTVIGTKLANRALRRCCSRGSCPSQSEGDRVRHSETQGRHVGSTVGHICGPCSAQIPQLQELAPFLPLLHPMPFRFPFGGEGDRGGDTLGSQCSGLGLTTVSSKSLSRSRRAVS